ncbi:MAG: nucleotidyl transferase AbiEii/AbiGii toxin family protein [Saprospiraceae bacterium]|nr:nucleotidyl transferase AbiEii/AbiGii toxin family protein [Saprospiraceae bacterium]
MKKIPSKEVFDQVAIELSVDPAFVEKDWHILQVLSVMTQLYFPTFQIIFSGGTALSKAYKLINRFSEDVDFRVDFLENITLRVCSGIGFWPALEKFNSARR